MVQTAGRYLRRIAIGALLMMGAGCGGSDAPPYQDPHPLPEEPLVVSAPEIGAHGGRFVHVTTVAPRTFNNTMANETSSLDVTHRLFAGLVDFDNARQEIVPMLATSWDVSDDSRTWTFRLRRGAKFSDGRDITSADVLFNFELMYDATLHPSTQDQLMMNGRPWTISAPDPHTVVITTPEPNGIVTSLLMDVRIMPKHVLEPAFRSGQFASAYGVNTPPDQIVTSGAFRLLQYVPNERVVLGRNPYWFGVDERQQRLPYLDELVFAIVPDQDTADLQIRAGQVDGLDRPKPENYAWYEANQRPDTFTLHDVGPELNSQMFWFNLNTVRRAGGGRRVGEPHAGAVQYSWFNNQAFRRAVSHAVDRDAMIRSIYFGDAVKNWSTTTPGNRLWHGPDIVKYDYDPAEAVRLLDGLGWRDRNGDGVREDASGNTIGFTLKTNSDNRIRVAMANFIRDDLARVGIRVTLTPVDFNTLVTNLRDDFQYEAALLGLQTGVPPDPSLGQNVWRSSGITHWWNARQPKPATPQEARIDALMDLMMGTTDIAARQAAWKETQDIVNTQAWLIWLPTQIAKLPVSNRFGNVQPSVIPERVLWNADRLFLKSRVN